MPKKTKISSPSAASLARKESKAQNDFFFLVVVSVFAALTIFAASFVNTTRQKAIQASQKPSVVDLAPLDIPPANPPVYKNPVKK